MQTKKQQPQTTTIPATPLRFVFSLSKQYPWLASGAIFSVLIAQAAELGAIYAVSNLVDSFNQAAGKTEQLSALFFGGMAFLILGMIDRIAWRSSGFLGVAWAIKVDALAFKKLYGYVTKHSHTYFISRFAGSISNKISNAAGNAGEIIINALWNILPEVIAMVITIILFWNIHWGLGMTLFVILAIVFFLNLWRVKHRRPLVVAYSAASSAFRGKGVDLITNISATRQYVRRDYEMNIIDKAISDRAEKDFRQSYQGEWSMVMNGVLGIVLILLILSGVYMMLQNDLATAGQLVLVLLLLGRVGYAFNVMGQMMNGFVRRYGDIQEGLDEVMVPHEIVDQPGAQSLLTDGGQVRWDNVVFDYGQNRVFDSFNLTIKPGQRLGLVGPSGAGKTTFVSLLLRQHDIQSGAITIDGQNIAEVTQDSLRAAIAVVPQEPLLFHRTIRENIAYGKPDASDEEIIAVAKKAQAHDFIMTLPEKYETMVGERGVKLSGGQKQRVAIARAMLKDAPILVLDEATSALDSESEVEIQKALHVLMAGKTVVAIAHRLSTLREMDRIIVLENGQIVEDGTHETLSKAGGTYERLWNHQAGGFLPE